MHMPRCADIVDRPGGERAGCGRAAAMPTLEAFLKKSPAERMAYWKAELAAASSATPAGRSARCATATGASWTRTGRRCIDTSATLKGNFAWHITRAFHLAGRCVGCDECTRACPAGIDLRLLNLSLAKAAEERVRLPRRHGPRGRAGHRLATPDRTRRISSDERDHLQSSDLPTGRPSGSARASAWPGPCTVKPDLVLYAPLNRSRRTAARRLHPPGQLDQGVRLSRATRSSTAIEFEGKRDRTERRRAADGRADRPRRPAVRRRGAADPRPRVQLGLPETSSTIAAARLTTVVTLACQELRRRTVSARRSGSGRPTDARLRRACCSPWATAATRSAA